MRTFLVSALFFGIACGPSTPSGNDGGSDASGDATASGNDGGGKDATPDTGGGGDGGKNACTDAIDALPGGCTRCWPAMRVLCTQGRPDVVLGFLQCLTKPSMCWDLGDPNTAGPCVQNVIDMNSDANVKAVQDKMNMLQCGVNAGLVVGGVAAAMSDADRVKFAACIENLTTCNDPDVEACFAGTSFDPKLCMN